jgi:hypothetical protein
MSFEPELVWGLFTRALGVVYLVAFASLHRDVLAIAGACGISPLSAQLDAMRRDYPGPFRFVRFPTLFWIHDSDRALRGGTLLGMLAACGVVTGIASTPALLVCWVLYLSYDRAVDLFYPWDCALLEAGVLALFLPSLALLPSLAASDAAPAAIGWAYRWLLFRVVFGFGKYKFFGPGTLHLDYLKSFLISQPLSTPFGVYASRWPRVVFAIALALLFLVEVPIPFLVFGPAPLRIAAACAIAALMIGIQLSGNFGFFNLIVLVLCIPLLDVDASLFDHSLLHHPLATLFAIFLFGAGIVCLPFNSWIAQAWPYWPAFDRVAALRPVAAFFRAVAPFRLVHAYGVFSPESGPPLKWVPVVEGTLDGERWEVYHYRFMPSTPQSPSHFVAPRMPRFDHALIYDALGISTNNFTASIFAMQNPYRFSRSGWMERLAQRLLEGEPTVLSLFAHDPFAGQKPIAIRVRLKTFERGTEGWVVRDAATHLPSRGLEPHVFERWLPCPELFHWDEKASRRASAVWRARIAAPEDETDLAVFFEEIAPRAAAIDPVDWRSLPLEVHALRARFSVPERDRMEALAARLAWRLAEAIERSGARDPWFDLGLLAHDALLEGRAFYERALRDPASARVALAPASVGRGMRVWALFRPEVVAFQARKARLRELTLRGAAREPPPIVPGFLRHLSELAHYCPDPDERPVRYTRARDGWRAEALEAAAAAPRTIAVRE